MATAKRIYLVTQLVKDGAPAHTKPVYRLVNATSAPAAIKHVSREHFECEVPKPHQLAEIAGSGVKVEQAGDSE